MQVASKGSERGKRGEIEVRRTREEVKARSAKKKRVEQKEAGGRKEANEREKNGGRK